MKFEGKDIFTIESLARGKPKMKPEVEKAAKLIKRIMEKYGIVRVTK